MYGLNVFIFVFFPTLLCSVQSSAIPMWEYLTRGEKMNHLFNMFVSQVEKHCANRPEPDCTKLLLLYGLTNLAKMEEESLDDMDPYQRGANEIVWDSMMKGSSKLHKHVSRYTTKSPLLKHDHHHYHQEQARTSTTTVRPSSDAPRDVEEMSFSDNEPGSLEAASSINIAETEPKSFLLGPMVVRVLPNGQPIPGEPQRYPKDEDVEELAPSKYKQHYNFELETTNSQNSIRTTSVPPITTTKRWTQPPPYQYKQYGFRTNQQRPTNYLQPEYTNTYRVRSPVYATY